MGGVKALEVNELIIELFNYCINRNINIQASHICGRLNTQDDYLSHRSRDLCYALPPHIFNLFVIKCIFPLKFFFLLQD